MRKVLMVAAAVIVFILVFALIADTAEADYHDHGTPDVEFPQPLEPTETTSLHSPLSKTGANLWLWAQAGVICGMIGAGIVLTRKRQMKESLEGSLRPIPIRSR